MSTTPPLPVKHFDHEVDPDPPHSHMIWVGEGAIVGLLGVGSTFAEAKADAQANLKALMEELKEMQG